MLQKLKQVKKIFNCGVHAEGDGAQVVSVIDNKDLPNLNPFLMLDYGSCKLPTGFPDHPHRGFETVSYILRGKMYHEDSKGNKGELEQGDVQWMTAGRGVLHAEMPASFTELSSAFQLWINLQAKHKMCEPQYQEYKKNQIPSVNQPGLTIKLIAGEAYGQKGVILTRTPAFYMDVYMEQNSKFEQNIPGSWNSLCFLYEGEGVFQGHTAEINQSVLLDTTQDDEKLIVESKNGCKFIFIAGEPINEPIVQKGPFVMNTQEEVEQAIADYELGQNGFEGAKTWKSKIRELSNKE